MFPRNKADALTKRMSQIEDFWLWLGCDCQRVRGAGVKFYLKHGNRTLAEFLQSLKCGTCGKGPTSAVLQETPHHHPSSETIPGRIELIGD